MKINIFCFKSLLAFLVLSGINIMWYFCSRTGPKASESEWCKVSTSHFVNITPLSCVPNERLGNVSLMLPEIVSYEVSVVSCSSWTGLKRQSSNNIPAPTLPLSSSSVFPGQADQIVSLVCSTRSAIRPRAATDPHNFSLSPRHWARSGFPRHRGWGRTVESVQGFERLCHKGTREWEAAHVWRDGQGVNIVQF